ncbi:DNA repair [Micractinium conductrix]|uniref:DNA repair n=1 Tax=Micractinium conductrix TaxID=554055 RepID=A0A2P6VI23_9CHLO|nr:DNA repair [Micractinium conductrix]|eukprot:PSC73730.1 DNA repair [Micractinium conductrix]
MSALRAAPSPPPAVGWMGRSLAREFSVAASRPRNPPAPRQRCLTLVRAASSSAKVKQLYVCSGCGEQTAQWSGQCKACGVWNSLEKVKILPVSESGGGGSGARAAARFAAGRTAGGSVDDDAPAPSTRTLRRSAWVQDSEAPQRLSDVSRRGFRARWRLQLPGENGRELARVLGGGVVPGSLTLVGGEPGVGKSTLLLQLADMLTRSSVDDSSSGSGPGSDGSSKGNCGAARQQDVAQPLPAQQQQDGSADGGAAAAAGGGTVLYISGEESVEQIGSRAERMGIAANSSIYVYSATRLDSVLDEVIRLQPSAVIVDSIQTVYLDEVSSSAGSVTQVRECATALLQVAKRERVPVFLVGHVTKSGDLAGPRVLEHIVDTVVYMEGGRQQPVRLVRCMKNRYGNTDEVGVFEMHDDGMQVVPNPSALFLSDRDLAPSVSSAVAVVLEGTRPLLMEVQALCSPVPHGSPVPPTRTPSGVNRQRLALLLAVLGKHTDIKPYSVDVHLNVTGGLEMNEPATDLAVACAIASSYYEQPIAHDVAMIGEVGLGGELRPVGNIERRIAEAAKLGFKTFVIPAASNVHASARLKGARLVECCTVVEAFRAVLGTRQPQ